MKTLSQRFSASKTALLFSPCTAWATPDAVWDVEEETEAMAKGSDLHAELEARIKDGSFKSENKDADALLKFLIKQEPRAFFSAEVKLPGGNDAPRDYSETPDSLVGTADVFGEEDEYNIILDWKSSYIGMSGASEQLKMLAAIHAASVDDGHYSAKDYALISVYSQKGNVDYRRFYFSRAEALELHSTAKGLLESASAVEVPGEHCEKRYCPMRKSCKAKQEQKQEALTIVKEEIVQITRKPELPAKVETPKDLRLTLEFLKQVEDWLEWKKDECSDFADKTSQALQITEIKAWLKRELDRSYLINIGSLEMEHTCEEV